MRKKLKKLWIRFLVQTQKMRLPLFQGLTVYDVFSFFFKGIVEGRVTSRAASVAFSFFLALFPGIIFLFSLIPYLPIEGIEQEVFYTFQRILPPDTYDAARSTIDDILTNQRSNLLSFGALLTLIFATNGVNALVSNFTHSYHEVEMRNFWRQQIASMLLTLVLSVLFLVGMVLIIFSSDVLNALLKFFYLEEVSPVLIESTRFILLLIIVQFAIALLYNFGPSRKRQWHFISPGSILANILIIISSAGFSYYVSNFAQYNKLYGSIGTVMVIMIWIYINALVLIVGFELNASIATLKLNHQQGQLTLEDA